MTRTIPASTRSATPAALPSSVAPLVQMLDDLATVLPTRSVDQLEETMRLLRPRCASWSAAAVEAAYDPLATSYDWFPSPRAIIAALDAAQARQGRAAPPRPAYRADVFDPDRPRKPACRAERRAVLERLGLAHLVETEAPIEAAEPADAWLERMRPATHLRLVAPAPQPTPTDPEKAAP